MEEEKMEPIVETSENAIPEKKNRLWVKISTLAVAAVLVAIVVVGVGIFRFGWNGKVVSAFQAVIPYPVAVVDWKFISKAEFDDRYRAFKQSVEQNQEFDFNDPANVEAIEDQKKQLLDRMIELRFEETLARKRNITISQSEVDNELEKIKVQTGLGQDELESLVSKLYGWTIPRFVDVVLVSQLREQKLQEDLAHDFNVNKDAHDAIKKVQERLNAGEDFAEVAIEASQDPQSAPLGGDLSWAPRGLYVKEFEDAAFNLQPGELSDIVITPFGYHIVEMLEKGINEETGAEQFHVRHILITTTDFYQWLDEQKAEASIWKVASL